MMTLRTRCLVFSAFLLLLASAGRASAQQAPPPMPPATGVGPLVLEPMQNGFVLAPEVKVTRFDRSTGALAGAYGGWIRDEHLLIGGGGYGLIHRKRDDRGLAYGGFVVGWFFNPKQPVSVSAKALAGFGRFSEPFEMRILRPYCLLPEEYLCSGMPMRDRDPFTRRLRFRTDFLVLEPELDVLADIGPRLRLSAGVGYRFTDESRAFDREAEGVTGAFSVQFRF